MVGYNHNSLIAFLGPLVHCWDSGTIANMLKREAVTALLVGCIGIGIGAQVTGDGGLPMYVFVRYKDRPNDVVKEVFQLDELEAFLHLNYNRLLEQDNTIITIMTHDPARMRWEITTHGGPFPGNVQALTREDTEVFVRDVCAKADGPVLMYRIDADDYVPREYFAELRREAAATARLGRKVDQCYAPGSYFQVYLFERECRIRPWPRLHFKYMSVGMGVLTWNCMPLHSIFHTEFLRMKCRHVDIRVPGYKTVRKNSSSMTINQRHLDRAVATAGPSGKVKFSRDHDTYETIMPKTTTLQASSPHAAPLANWTSCRPV